MLKVIDYKSVKCGAVKKMIDQGWQPWGNAVPDWDGSSQRAYQPMVKYESPREIYKRR